jgi:N6-L-threonylcarbamoyladenine synthase
MSVGEVDAVAATAGPGLIGGVMVALLAGKGLALAAGKPLIAVNHLEGHALSPRLIDPDLDFPYLLLLVSGGHTELLLMTGHGRYEQLGRTLDDAAGEAFDKGARLLGLGYPGGPAIQKTAAVGDAAAFALPRAWLGESHDFSFSGLKTALLREVEPHRLPDEDDEPEDDAPFRKHRPPRFAEGMPVADLAASFQEAIVDVLAVKTVTAARTYGTTQVVLAGGVAANRALRERLSSEIAAISGTMLRVPALSYCTDNAAMVAAAGYYAMRRGAQSGWELDVASRLPVGG